jgi:hypothetical protein
MPAECVAFGHRPSAVMTLVGNPDLPSGSRIHVAWASAKLEYAFVVDWPEIVFNIWNLFPPTGRRGKS